MAIKIAGKIISPSCQVAMFLCKDISDNDASVHATIDSYKHHNDVLFLHLDSFFFVALCSSLLLTV